MKKFIIILIIIVAIGIGVYYLTDHKTEAPAEQPTTQDQSSNSIIEPPVTAPTTTQSNNQPSANSTSSANQESQTPDGGTIQVVEVDFDGTQFTPKTVNIHANDWVFFKNTRNTGFWVASDPHPTHTDYPGFDALKTIAPGGEYKFQFTKVGSWGYHDHLDPSITGTVVVSQ